jgi:hypothetical protein
MLPPHSMRYVTLPTNPPTPPTHIHILIHHKGMSAKHAAIESLHAISSGETDFLLADAKTVGAVQAKAQFPYLLSYLTGANEKGKGKEKKG